MVPILESSLQNPVYAPASPSSTKIAASNNTPSHRFTNTQIRIQATQRVIKRNPLEPWNKNIHHWIPSERSTSSPFLSPLRTPPRWGTTPIWSSTPCYSVAPKARLNRSQNTWLTPNFSASIGSCTWIGLYRGLICPNQAAPPCS